MRALDLTGIRIPGRWRSPGASHGARLRHMRCQPRLPLRVATVAPAAVAILGAPMPASGQVEAARPVESLGADLPLHDVRDVEMHADRVVVLTGAASGSAAVYVLDDSGVRAWGRHGRGPGELENPVAVLTSSDKVWVLDAIPGNSRLTRYKPDGELENMRTFRGAVVTDMQFGEGAIVVSMGGMGSRGVDVVRLGPEDAVLMSYAKPETIRLASADGPTRRFSVFPPYAPAPVWAALPDGALVTWDGSSDRLQVLDWTGELKTTLPLPAANVEVTAVDREAWFASTFPPDFLGRQDDPLRAIRRTARNEVVFPAVFPRALALLPDAEEGFWLKRSPAASGETWIWMGTDAARTIRLPAGREARAFGRTMVAATASDESTGIEYIELFAKLVPSQNPLPVPR